MKTSDAALATSDTLVSNRSVPSMGPKVLSALPGTCAYHAYRWLATTTVEHLYRKGILRVPRCSWCSALSAPCPRCAAASVCGIFTQIEQRDVNQLKLHAFPDLPSTRASSLAAACRGRLVRYRSSQSLRKTDAHDPVHDPPSVHK
jgi:hypothetical protein